MLPIVTTLLALSASVLAVSRVVPPKGAIIVGNGHHRTIQSAIDALKEDKKTEQIIFVYSGLYEEQLTIKNLKGPLKMMAYTTDTSSYLANEVTVVAAHNAKDESENKKTATLLVETDNFKLYNFNIVNNFGPGTQALALAAVKKYQAYYGCAFKGFQDTVLTTNGPQIFANCYVEGATDFFYGKNPSFWAQNTNIGLLTVDTGYITASGRDQDNDSYMVFNASTISAAPGQGSGNPGSYALGRPWRDYARVVFQYSWLSTSISKEGWSVWDKGDERVDHVVFGEFQNKGPGAAGKRVWFSHKLSKPVRPAEVLGNDFESAYFFDFAHFYH